MPKTKAERKEEDKRIKNTIRGVEKRSAALSLQLKKDKKISVYDALIHTMKTASGGISYCLPYLNHDIQVNDNAEENQPFNTTDDNLEIPNIQAKVDEEEHASDYLEFSYPKFLLSSVAADKELDDILWNLKNAITSAELHHKQAEEGKALVLKMFNTQAKDKIQALVDAQIVHPPHYYI